MQLEWSGIKAISISKGVGLIHSDEGSRHFITLNEAGSPFFCFIEKSDPRNSDQGEFEDLYLTLVNKPAAQRTESLPFSNASGFRFRGASFSGACAANTTTDIDYKITQERFINGGRLLVDNIGLNDRMTFQVVDKDNVLGRGAGVVLDEFISEYYVPQDGNLEVRLDYPARIMAGLYLRIKYTSTHASGGTVKCNLYLHWKAS